MNVYNKILAQYFGAKKYTLFQRIKRWFVKRFESNHQRLIREEKEYQENVARAYKLFNDELKKPNVFQNILDYGYHVNTDQIYKLNSNDPKSIFTLEVDSVDLVTGEIACVDLKKEDEK